MPIKYVEGWERADSSAGRVTDVTHGSFGAMRDSAAAPSTYPIKQYNSTVNFDQRLKVNILVEARPNAETTIIALGPEGSGTSRMQVYVNLTPAGYLRLYTRTDGLVGTAPAPLNNSQWYIVEVQLNAIPAVGSRVAALRIDETVVASTSTGTFDGTRGFDIGRNIFTTGDTAGSIVFDDLIVTRNEWPGRGVVASLTPNGQGSADGWNVVGAPAAWQAVDDDPADDATTYISADTSGAFTLFTLDVPSIIGAGDAIRGAMLRQRNRVLSGNNGPSFNLIIRDGSAGTIRIVSNIAPQNTYWKSGSRGDADWETEWTDTDPDGVDPFTRASLATLQYGFSAGSGLGSIDITAAWVDVVYLPAEAPVSETFPITSSGAQTQTASTALRLRMRASASGAQAQSAASTSRLRMALAAIASQSQASLAALRLRASLTSSSQQTQNAIADVRERVRLRASASQSQTTHTILIARSDVSNVDRDAAGASDAHAIQQASSRGASDASHASGQYIARSGTLRSSANIVSIADARSQRVVALQSDESIANASDTQASAVFAYRSSGDAAISTDSHEIISLNAVKRTTYDDSGARSNEDQRSATTRPFVDTYPSADFSLLSADFRRSSSDASNGASASAQASGATRSGTDALPLRDNGQIVAGIRLAIADRAGASDQVTHRILTVRASVSVAGSDARQARLVALRSARANAGASDARRLYGSSAGLRTRHVITIEGRADARYIIAGSDDTVIGVDGRDDTRIVA